MLESYAEVDYLNKLFVSIFKTNVQTHKYEGIQIMVLFPWSPNSNGQPHASSITNDRINPNKK